MTAEEGRVQYWDRDGNEILGDDETQAVVVWARMYEDNDYRQVKVTPIDSENETFVSTIWQGIETVDRDEQGRCMIFETAIVTGKGDDRRILTAVRNGTEADALRTHDDFVATAQSVADLAVLRRAFDGEEGI